MSRFLILSFFIASISLKGQEFIANGSFEGSAPILNKVPIRWYICDEKSTPDIQPSTSKKPAVFGKAYLGLVARVFVENHPEQNGTVESVFQQLQDTLDPGREYRLSLQLVHDPNHTTLSQELAGPGKINIYIGKDFCDGYRLIWSSDTISHEAWLQYEIFFIAECNDRFIKIEAGFGDSTNYNYNYVMVDSVSLQPSGIDNYEDTIDCSIIPDSIPEDTADISYFPCKIFVPTAFSPNNDGINDIFKIYGDCNVKRFTMHIFNRWGDKIFQTQDQDQGWSGYFRGHLADPGVYLYQVLFEYIDEQGSTRYSNLSKTLTLLR